MIECLKCGNECPAHTVQEGTIRYFICHKCDVIFAYCDRTRKKWRITSRYLAELLVARIPIRPPRN